MRSYFRPLWLAFFFLIPVSAEPPPETKPNKSQAIRKGAVERLWADLADADAAKAYRDSWSLVNTPQETVLLFAAHLKPVVAPDQATVERWIDDLGRDTFALREKANVELTKLAGLAEPNLRKALMASPSLEKGRRLQSLMNRLAGPITLGDQLRAVRTVETLERIGSDAAKTLLTTYAAGAAGARLTQDAKETLARWQNAEPATFKRPAARTDLYGDALPVGAVGRLGTVRFRREGSYSDGLVFLPDGKSLITNSEQGVQIWEYPSGRLLREISTLPMYNRGFALAPDGKSCAIGGYTPSPGNTGHSELRVLELPSGKLVKAIPTTTGATFKLAFSADGKLLFSVSSTDGVLHIQEIDSGKEIKQKKFPGESINSMAVSKDGAYVALEVGSGPDTLKLFLWKWQDQEPRRVDLPANTIDRIGFSPDGKVLIAVGVSGGVFGWEVASGKLSFHQKPSDPDYFFIDRPAFAPDGSTMAVTLRARRDTFHGKIQFFEPATGRSQGTSDIGADASLITFSPDSRTLAATSGCSMRFWDVGSRREIIATGDGHTSSASSIIPSQKGVIATAGDDGTVRLWDATSTKQLWKFSGKHWVRGLALSPDARLLGASIIDDTVRVLESRTGREIYRLPGHGEMGGHRALTFTHDSRNLISWGDDYYLRVWDMKTGKARIEHAVRPNGIEFPKDEDALALSKSIPSAGISTFSPDCKILVVDIGGMCRLFDIASCKETAILSSNEGAYRYALAFSSNSRLLLSATLGNNDAGTHSLSIFDVTSGKTLQRHVPAANYVGGVAFAPDGRTFATSAGDDHGGIILYETASGKPRATIRGIRGSVRTLTFFPDCRRLTSGQSDSTMLIWDLATPEFARNGP